MKVLLLILVVTWLFRCRLAAKVHGLEFNPEDIVLAQPTCVHRLPLAQFSRAWRQGIRSFTVVNNTQLAKDLNRDPRSQEHHEAYGYWEDDSIAGGSWRGGNVGDTRAAVTPFLAHKHFGEAYKWMLYGDDDTLFYMTGVLKLLSQFDPEVPLAITDNIWYYALHPSPFAPRCLPCGFNTSTIQTNHSFTPRPACPFCTRALACGTYGPRYRCNATHLADLEQTFGPRLARGTGAAAAEGTDAEAGAEAAERLRSGMRVTGPAYASWMSRHVALKAAYPYKMRTKPAMDWEMRDPPDHGLAGAHSGDDSGVAAAGGEDADADSDARRRRRQLRRGRRRRRGRALQQQPAEEDSGSQAGSPSAIVSRRKLLARRPTEQPYVDGTPWLSAALGTDLAAQPEQREALRLPHPFCTRHDERLHARAAPSCLVSISGHGGTGIIFSVGLLRLIEPEEAVRFILEQRGCGGGDCLLGRALWFRMGIGFTDPGSALQHGSERYSAYARFIDSNLQMPSLVTLADPTAALLNRRKGTPRAPACDAACVWLIENVVGTHVRAQLRQVNHTVAALRRHLERHALAYEWVAAARRDPEVAAGRRSVAKWVQERYGGGGGGAARGSVDAAGGGGAAAGGGAAVP